MCSPRSRMGALACSSGNSAGQTPGNMGRTGSADLAERRVQHRQLIGVPIEVAVRAGDGASARRCGSVFDAERVGTGSALRPPVG